jgi:hypothetical protein
MSLDKKLPNRLLVRSLIRLFLWILLRRFAEDFLFFLILTTSFISPKLMKKEARIKTEEIQEISSESDEDNNTNDGEDASESEGSGNNNSSDGGQGDEEGESSDQRTSSPKVDIVG